MMLNLSDGARLNYLASGDSAKPALLLWHGARCTLRQWDHVIAELEQTFYVLRFDIRGAGQSIGAADSAYDFETYAEDVEQLLTHLDVERCHIWSMAWGSRAALAFCALKPMRVISAALFDLSIGQADVEAQIAGNKAAREKQKAAGYIAPPPPAGWNDHLDDETLKKSLGAAANADLHALARLIHMPVLIATGDHDPNLESSRAAQALMSDAALVEMTDVGHGSVIMQPDLCTKTFLTFVSSHV
jgi:pimeloyl-ACP methyl ester carboxylesterase